MEIFVFNLHIINMDSKQGPSCFDYCTNKQDFTKESFDFFYAPKFSWILEN
jgi:hypothetical protein